MALWKTYTVVVRLSTDLTDTDIARDFSRNGNPAEFIRCSKEFGRQSLWCRRFALMVVSRTY
jgi:hypothetical protein